MREVDEAVRQDRFDQAARRYGIPAAILVVLGLAAFGGYLWWEGEQRAAAEQEAVVLVRALDRIEAGQDAGAIKDLGPLLTSDAPGYRVAARMAQAGLAAEDGDTAKAARLFDAVAADEDAPRAFRDLATIRSTAVQFDTLEPQKVIDRVKPLAAPEGAFFPIAGELVAMAYVKLDKPDLAGPLFAEIARDDGAPETLRARARQMAGLLGTDAIDNVDEVMAAIRRGSQAAGR